MVCFSLFSCKNEKKLSELTEITVDIEQNGSLLLSEIVDKLEIIKLETSDKSLINPDIITRIIESDNEVIITQTNKILVFNKDGRFIRNIGSRGQGPGEFNYIQNATFDKENKHLYVISGRKIICYELNGKLLKESRPILSNLPYVLFDINYYNEELLLIVEQMGKDEQKGSFKHSLIYRMSDNFNIFDSCSIRKVFLGDGSIIIHWGFKDFIFNGRKSVFLYYCDIKNEKDDSPKRAFCDTLYRFEENLLLPELKLNFINGGKNKNIELFNLYRSSRFIFAYYSDKINKNYYSYCFDIKTGKGYNLKGGYTDDINKIEGKIQIRPFVSDTEKFYFYHTHMKPDDIEEPNPTLYIGTLKK